MMICTVSVIQLSDVCTVLIEFAALTPLTIYAMRIENPRRNVMPDIESSMTAGHSDVCFAHGPRPARIVSLVVRYVESVMASWVAVAAASPVTVNLVQNRKIRMYFFSFYLFPLISYRCTSGNSGNISYLIFLLVQAEIIM